MSRPKNRSRGDCRLTTTMELGFITLATANVSIVRRRLFSTWLKFHSFNGAFHDKPRLSQFLNLFLSYIFAKLAQDQAAVGDIDQAQFGDDGVHDFNTGEWEAAFLEDFRRAFLCCVLHRDDDAPRSGNEVHGA